MKVSVRILLVIYTGVLSFFLFLITIISLGWRSPLIAFANYIGHPAGRVLTAVLSFIFAIIGIKTIIQAFFRLSDTQALVKETPQGKIKVSLIAIENLVKRTVRQLKGVKDVKAIVRLMDAKKIQVQIRVITSPEISVPSLSSDIQESVKDTIFDIIGIEVNQITVVFDNIAVDSKSRLD